MVTLPEATVCLPIHPVALEFNFTRLLAEVSQSRRTFSLQLDQLFTLELSQLASR